MKIDELFSDSRPPYVVTMPSSLASSLRECAEEKKWRSWEIDLRTCTDIASIYAKFAKAMDFPIKDSNNWNALNDMLTDLDWAKAKGHLLLLTGAMEFAQTHPAEHAELFDVLAAVGEHWHSWQNMAHPFKTAIMRDER